MIQALEFARWPLTLLAAAVLAGCTTPPQKPPQPKPMVSQAHKVEGPSGTVSAGGAGAPGAGQGYGPASANAAEVDEEEVAADGTTRLISSSRRAAPPSSASGSQASDDTGGASMSQSSSARATGGNGAPPPQPASSPLPVLEGAHFDQPEDALRPAGDILNAAPTSGARDGRIDAQPDARHGLRGGRDESGATSGAAPVSAPRPSETGTPPTYENDILAQQLREAAEKEKDPVLREKLWIEYHKYKAGL